MGNVFRMRGHTVEEEPEIEESPNETHSGIERQNNTVYEASAEAQMRELSDQQTLEVYEDIGVTGYDASVETKLRELTEAAERLRVRAAAFESQTSAITRRHARAGMLERLVAHFGSKTTRPTKKHTGSKMKTEQPSEDVPPWRFRRESSTASGHSSIHCGDEIDVWEDEQLSNSDDTFVSHRETHKIIGFEGGCIELAGCSVEFQPGTFEVERDIRVTAEVDSSKWPEGDDVISPIFEVDVGQIKKAAKVRLSTWIVPDEKYVVEIMHSTNRSQKANRAWEKIAKCHIKDENIVEFDCSNFSGLFARIAKFFSGQVVLSLLPSLYVYDRQFIVAMHLNSEVIRDSFAKFLEKTFYKSATLTKHSMTGDAKLGDEIPIGVSCSRPETGFEFDPTGNYNCSIDKKIRKGNVFHKQCVIYSELKEARNIVIHFKCRADTPDAISYRWASDQENSRPSPSPNPPAEGNPTEAPVVNYYVTVDNSEAGIINIGGTVNQKTCDSPGEAVEDV